MARPLDPLDADTLDPPSPSAVELPAHGLALTVALHPDLARVGERATLIEGASVSRADPVFADAGGRSTGPLSDPHVSRAPLRITPRGDDVELDATAIRGGVDVEGTSVTGTRTLRHDELQRGVVIGLAQTVLLVLRRTRTMRLARRDHGLVGVSDAVDTIRAGIEAAALHGDPVLLLGSSGTGKELVAAAIHRASARSGRAFVAVNMATLHPSTAASELFGHSRGAFTGAEGTHSGVFGRADGGTLFLDEVGDTAAVVQPMLLRALDGHEIAPVGGRSAHRVDVRIVAATDLDVTAAADRGDFRVPLFHRLAAHTIRLAPLRDRREDVMPLLLRFLDEQHAQRQLPPYTLVTELLLRSWPGNVRELRNAARTLQREGPAAVALTTSHASNASERPSASAASKGEGAPSDEVLVATLRKNGFRIAATARDLGVAKNTLYRWMERCPLLRRARDLDAAQILAAWGASDDLEAVAEKLEVSARALQLRLRELGLERDG
ncbi:MAG: sigma-54-dependent Fis family transcriptional regulator [Deltaproteobacteria bacterium]|nr:sigma-54-dependent Fis family transcriptional regulator [Deltaproteobacteria bacterium]